MPSCLQGHDPVHAAVVELDALADAVGAAAQDDHLPAGGRDRFVLLVVGRVEVRGEGFELRRAGVDDLVGRHDAGRLADAADFLFALAGQKPDVLVGEAHALGLAQGFGPQRAALGVLARDHVLELDQLPQVFEKPDVDPGQPADLLRRHPQGEGLPDLEDALRGARAQVVHERRAAELPMAALSRAWKPDQPFSSERRVLLQRLLEGAADAHGLAHGFHLRGRAGGRCPGTSRNPSAAP